MSDENFPEANPYAAPTSRVTAFHAMPGGRAIGYAGFFRRFVAAMIDLTLISVAAAVYVFALLALVLAIPSTDPTVAAAVFMAGYALLCVLGAAYFVVMESSSMQATLGKAAMGLRVVDLYGRRISVMRSLGRYSGKVISSLPFMLGYVLAAFSEKRQALHDMMAGTLVVRVI